MTETESLGPSARVGIECPKCHNTQFLEVQLEQPIGSSPAAREIERELMAWIASRCPDHLGNILKRAMN